MVAINERRQGTSIIQKILKKAQVPPTWYSIAKPFECRLSVTDEKDGIHVFIPERGERIGENIHHDWYEAIKDKADGCNSLLIMVNPIADTSELSLKGTYQQENLSLALEAINFVFPEISREIIDEGLKKVKHPCRFEYLKDKNKNTQQIL